MNPVAGVYVNPSQSNTASGTTSTPSESNGSFRGSGVTQQEIRAVALLVKSQTGTTKNIERIEQEMIAGWDACNHSFDGMSGNDGYAKYGAYIIHKFDK